MLGVADHVGRYVAARVLGDLATFTEDVQVVQREADLQTTERVAGLPSRVLPKAPGRGIASSYDDGPVTISGFLLILMPVHHVPRR